MLKRFIRLLKTSPLLVPALAAVDAVLWLTDTLARWSAELVPQGGIATRPRTLLVIKLDALGDYVLWRTYWPYLKQTGPGRVRPFAGYTVHFLGNVANRSLAETFDREHVAAFIWVDIYKLSTNLLYRFRVVRGLRLRGYAAVLCPTLSRVLVLDDFMARATGAPVRVGTSGDLTNLVPWERRWGNACYTQLLPATPGLLFEQARNRETLTALLSQDVPLLPPRFDPEHSGQLPDTVNLPERYVVLSLGAGQPERLWPTERWAKVLRWLNATSGNVAVVLTGTAEERTTAQTLRSQLPTDAPVHDLTGQLSLPQLLAVLSRATLLLSHDTGTVHLAVSVQTPVVVVSQGKSLVRWHPYPTGLADVRYVYPPAVEAHRPDFAAIAPALNPESPYSMEEVSVERVIDTVKVALAAPTT